MNTLAEQLEARASKLNKAHDSEHPDIKLMREAAAELRRLTPDTLTGSNRKIVHVDLIELRGLVVKVTLDIHGASEYAVDEFVRDVHQFGNYVQTLVEAIEQQTRE
jgi:hypothetical protein